MKIQVATKLSKPYIIPTLYGIAYFFLILNIFALGYYRHSSPFHTVGLTLSILGLVAMIQSNNSMRGITCKVQSIDFGEEGGSCPLVVSLFSATREGHFNLQLDLEKIWSKDEPARLSFLKGQQSLGLSVRCGPRGIFYLRSIKISSRGLFGLFYVWTWLPLPVELVVYPKPVGNLPLPLAMDGELGQKAAGEDFAGHRPYQAGSPLRHVDWKAFARGQKLLMKDFQGQEMGGVKLDLDLLHKESIDVQMRQLSAWIFLCAEQNRPFSLQLGSYELPSGRGVEHMRSALRALAEWENPA